MFALKFASYAHLILKMSKTSRNLRAFSWGKFSWTEMICVKKLTLCNSAFHLPTLVGKDDFSSLIITVLSFFPCQFPLFGCYDLSLDIKTLSITLSLKVHPTTGVDTFQD